MREPVRLNDKLAKDRNMRSAVDALIIDFEPWFKDSKLPFFPDYTDHDISHVEDVLTSATSLVSNSAWKVITAQDAGMLIIATLLHDCAMHLTEDGFIALITGKTKHHGVKGFDNKSWPELWNDFLFSAMRYDDRTIEAIFGQPVTMRRPPLNPSEMTQQDRKLIGEFLRRHHGRLAHEIALAGVPGPADDTIKLSGRLGDDLADLAGLIARSHSLSLRATFGYLDKNFHQRSYRGVHAIYLMVLLRIADYLQIQSERAPKQMLQVKRIQSPISRQEWNAHGAVVNIVPNELDPESILIQAKPRDVKTYLHLKEWLEGIQSELDTSWAVLGEVYAPVVAMRNLGLVLRRVRSNLDDEETFAKQAPFVPKRIEFDIARAETLKLLIRPLYGDKPEIGIRELVQNAVDAVRELWDLQEQTPTLGNLPLVEQGADVVVWLDDPDQDGFAWLTVSDRGVGMTEEVIRDYFLKAGASYRHSDTWAKQHETGDQLGSNIGPKSRVLRTGRFGIGVLAAFLLGDYLEVATRHLSSIRGIRFSTTLEPGVIELTHDESIKVGTQVRVRINRVTYERLSKYGSELWDWYCLKKPSVLRLLGRESDALPQLYVIPDASTALPIGWHNITDERFTAVHWSPTLPYHLACNGIKVVDISVYELPTDLLGRASSDLFSYPGIDTNALNLPHSMPDELSGNILRPKLPFVSVFDPDGNLPLNLLRTMLSEVDKELTHRLSIALMDYLLAYLLVKTPITLEQGMQLRIPDFLGYRFGPTRYEKDQFSVWPWFYRKDGLSIIEPTNIQDAKIRVALVQIINVHQLNTLAVPSGEAHYSRYDALFFVSASPMLDTKNPLVVEPLLDGFKRIVQESQRDNLGAFRSVHWPQLGSRVAISKVFPQKLLRQFKAIHRRYGENLRIQQRSHKVAWTRISTSDCPPTRLTREISESLPTLEGEEQVQIAVEWYFPDPDKQQEETSAKPSMLTQRWREIIREPVIPFNLEERRTKLAYAYRRLGAYLNDFTPET